MKNDVSLMTLPKIKKMLKLRLFSLLMAVFFTLLTVVFAVGKQVMHWPWAGFLLLAATCVMLAVASCTGFLFLNRKLSGSGL